MSDVSVRLWAALAILCGLAGVLIALMPAEALARPIFQSPLTQPPTGTPTATVRVTATVTATAPAATATVAATVPPALRPDAPADAPAGAPQAPAQVPGFLPPPTLSANNHAPPLLVPGGGPSVAASATPAPRPAPTGTPAGPLSLARLIDLGVLILSYVWLGCGILVLLGVAFALVWVARGRRQV